MTHYALANEAWLSQNHRADDLVVIDTRAAANYWAGHLEHARHLDAALLTLQRTDAASIARFQALLGWTLSTLGIDHQSRVLVYGAANEVSVSRVAWALGYAGVEQIFLLDGGLAALQSPVLTQHAPTVAARSFTLRPVEAFLATADEALAISNGQASASVLVDAREHDEFIGLRSNARRHGRIPGAQPWDARRELDADGRFQAAPAIAQDAARIARAGDRLVAYCGGGGRAARTFVALQLAGRTQAAVYPASWNEWGNQETLPIASGEAQALAA